MEVRIRLQKAGKISSKVYNYRIVAMSRKEGRDGRNLDILGYYDPAKKPASFAVNLEKVQKWLDQGAQMTDTVRSLVNKTKKSEVPVKTKEQVSKSKDQKKTARKA